MVGLYKDIMCEFMQDKHYYFIGDPQLIKGLLHIDADEDNSHRNSNSNSNNDNKTQLGKFIEYVGLPYVGDWIYDALARFECGIISRKYYDKVFVEGGNNDNCK
jgi:hypothetical protein